MASALFALSLVYLVLGRSALTDGVSVTRSDAREKTFVSAKIGEDVTLPCCYEEDSEKWLYWFKQNPGQEAKLVSTLFDKGGVFHGGFKHKSRFSLGTKDERFPLKIKSVELSDSATYLCLKPLNGEVVLKGVSLHVWGSALNIRASLHQSASESLHPGDSLNLSCQVPAEVQRHPQAGNYICSVVSCAPDTGGVVSLPWLYFLIGLLAGALVASLALWVCKMTSGGETSHNDNAKEIQESHKMYFPALLGGGRGDQTWSKCAYYCKNKQ